MHLRLFRRVDDLGVGRARLANLDVFTNGSLEENRVLQDHAHVAAHHVQGKHAVINAVDFHRALLDFIEAGNELDQRGFAATGEADQRDLSSCRDMQVDALEDGPLRGVAKGDVLEEDIAAQPRWPVEGRVALNDLWRLLHHLLNALRSG